MRIAQVSPLWVPVPPRTYGGIELIVSLLTEELVVRSHDVTLFASGDSATSATLIPGSKVALWTMKDARSPHAVINRYLKMVHDRRKNYDLIHNHFDFFMFPLVLGNNSAPVLTTLHRPIDSEEARVLRSYPSVRLCAISEDQRTDAEERGIVIDGVVYNGIDVAQYPFESVPGDYLLYVGRLNAEKGIVTAIEIAKAANQRLVIAGNMAGPAEWNYFFAEVQPRLNDENITFVGEVDFVEKTRLMRGAKALLFPIDRREPFGLVMIEAMACGAPVIAFRRGSVPEVIVHNETGFIVDTAEEAVEVIKHLDLIDRAACRKRVEDHFTLKHMADAYEQIYKKIIA